MPSPFAVGEAARVDLVDGRRGPPRGVASTRGSYRSDETSRGGMKKLLGNLDTFQQRHRVVALPVATFKRFGEHGGGRLASTVSYWSFFSIFPLMLAFVTVLNIVLEDRPDTRQQLLDGALGQVPLIASELGRRRSRSAGAPRRWSSACSRRSGAGWRRRARCRRRSTTSPTCPSAERPERRQQAPAQLRLPRRARRRHRGVDARDQRRRRVQLGNRARDRRDRHRPRRQRGHLPVRLRRDDEDPSGVAGDAARRDRGVGRRGRAAAPRHRSSSAATSRAPATPTARSPWSSPC